MTCQPSAFIRRAASNPIPEEQPVIRTRFTTLRAVSR